MPHCKVKSCAKPLESEDMQYCSEHIQSDEEHYYCPLDRCCRTGGKDKYCRFVRTIFWPSRRSERGLPIPGAGRPRTPKVVPQQSMAKGASCQRPRVGPRSLPHKH